MKFKGIRFFSLCRGYWVGFLCLSLLSLVFLSGCDQFDLYNELEKAVAEPVEKLLLIPPEVSLVANGGITFTTIGGIPPYSYSVVTGAGSISSAGVYDASFSAGVDTIRATDQSGQADEAVVTVAPVTGPLAIVPSALTLSTNDIYFFTAVGGTPPYSYARIAGTGSVDPVTGKYTAPGSPDTDIIEVTDGAMNIDTATVTILAGLVIIPQSVTLPANNNQAFTASGGIPPYTFSMESGAGSVTLPGFYTAPGAPGTDKVKVTDNAGSSTLATVTITAPQPLNIVPSSYIVLVNGTHTFTAYGGTPPYTFTKISGNGSITVGGGYTAPAIPGVDLLRVTDSALLTSDAVVTVVDFGLLTIIPATVTVEQNDNYTFSASGGIPLYSYSVPVGSGFINSSTGVYTAPATLGTETVRVTDSALDTADATVYVAPAAPSNLVADGTDPPPPNDPQATLLTWTDNATGIHGFKLERKLSGGSYTEFAVIPEDPAPATFYLDTGFPPTLPYSYRVRAFAGTVYSGYSNEDFAAP